MPNYPTKKKTERCMSEADYESYLIQLPSGTSRLETLGEQIECHKNYVLCRAGQVPKYCYVVKSGRVVSYEYSANGEERIYNFNEKNSVLLESNVLFNKIVPVSFKTSKPSVLIRISKESLLEAIRRDPRFSLDLMESMSEKFLSAMEQIRQFNVHSATWKICNLLLIFAGHYGIPYDGKVLIEEKISQQLMSSMLGINRITAVRAIKELKDMSLIEIINGYYCIRDPERLRTHQRMLDNL